MNKKEEKNAEPIEHKKMHLYKLLRTKKIDKAGRPAIFFNEFKNKALIWAATTVKNENIKEIPLEIKINDKINYIYSYNLERIKTKDLIQNWTKNKYTDEIYTLNDEEQKQLISKFSEGTNQKDPYQIITELETKIKQLEIEQEKLKLENITLSLKNKTLNNEKQILKTKEISDYERE